jgi:Fe-S cluster assembly ATP-binding protein
MANILAVRNLCVETDGIELLHEVTLTIPAGEVHALLGPNGCGKTTLIMTIMGYPQYLVTAGDILFDGVNIAGLPITQRARLGIGLAQQRPPTIIGVKLQHLVDYVGNKDTIRLAEINQWGAAFRLDQLIDRNINGALSGGEIKRSELFQLLITHPRFAMLDEPDSGVDLETLPLVGQMVNSLLTIGPGCPVRRNAALIITHTSYILDYVPVDRAHIMLAGRIECSGNPQLIVEGIRQHGYEGCVACLKELERGN